VSIFPDIWNRTSREIDPSILKIQSEIKKVVKGSINVYYPGIGGGEEPVDSTSPFIILGANNVFGIDPFEHPSNVEDLSQKRTNYDFSHIEKDLLKLLSETKDKLKVEGPGDDEMFLKYQFKLYGIPRTLEIYKIPTDGEKYVPSGSYNVVYSRRTVGVVENLPPVVYQKAKVIYFKGEVGRDAQSVQRVGEEHEFRNIDLASLTGEQTRFYKARLLVKST
jgi:hypothetical protein